MPIESPSISEKRPSAARHGHYILKALSCFQRSNISPFQAQATKPRCYSFELEVLLRDDSRRDRHV